jgi:hypothetical protein
VSDADKQNGGSGAGTNSDSSGVEAAIQRIRDTAKWAVAAFAAIGAALAAGTQFSSLGSVQEPWRVLTAAGAAVMGLLAVMVAIWKTFDLLMPGTITMADLVKTAAKKPTFDVDHRDLYQERAATVDELKKKLERAALDRDAAASRASQPRASKADREAADAREEELAELDAIASGLRKEVGFERLEASADRWKLWVTGSIVVAGTMLMYFAWAANPPKSTPPTVSLAGANLSHADLAGANLAGVDLRGANLSWANLRGANLKDADLTGVIWTHATCPDGQRAEQEGGACHP